MVDFSGCLDCLDCLLLFVTQLDTFSTSLLIVQVLHPPVACLHPTSSEAVLQSRLGASTYK